MLQLLGTAQSVTAVAGDDTKFRRIARTPWVEYVVMVGALTPMSLPGGLPGGCWQDGRRIALHIRLIARRRCWWRYYYWKATETRYY